MKFFLTTLTFLLSCFFVKAQQNRFIYLQTENGKPFFVKLNNKIFNSFPSGYLIIPKLDDGLYSLVIGFPETENELEFNYPVKNKDVGFIVKSSGENWQLLNVQTLDIIIPDEVITKPVIVYEKVTDPFSTMLANAVRDTTILRKDVAIEIFPEKPNEQKDTADIVSNTEVAVTDNPLTADSSNKDIAIIIPEKFTDTFQQDTTSTIVNTDIAIAKPDDLSGSDSIQIDIGKVSDKAIVQNQNDTVTTDLANVVIIKSENVKTDSAANNDVVKKVPENINEVLKDTAQIIPPEVAVTKSSKKKKSKKEKSVMQDSLTVKNEVVREIIPDIIENKDTSRIIISENDKALVRSVIKRKSKKSNRNGLEMMYIDKYGESIDTILVLIPSDKKKQIEESKTTEPLVSVSEIKQADKPEDQVKDKDNYKITKEEKQIIKEANKDVKSSMINSDCKNFATDEDFLKIRKKMVAEDSDNDMIKAARKIFKTRCFTTEQIKNLSVLFLRDEGKYMFFEAAYPFVSDSDLYHTLEKQLTDNYYIIRFKAMVNK